MPFAAALSEHPDAATAVGEVCGHVLEVLREAPDVALLFVTAAHEAVIDQIVATVRTIVDPAILAGCVAPSVVGTEREVEERPGMSLWAAVTGPAEAVRLEAVSVGPTEMAISGWPDDDDLPFEPSGLVLLADPNSFPAEAFLEFLDDRHPGLPVVGGFALAPSPLSPGGPALILDGVRVNGAVGVFLGPGVSVETVVSQGCRPIGEPWAVTSVDGNIVRSLGGKPPLERLVALAQDALTEEEVELVSRGALHIGRVIDEHKPAFGRGDFLVRNVLGGDQISGAIAVGDRVDVGTTLQFHVRDASAADEDLHLLLHGRSADAALLFTCNGRGTYTFGEPDHDAVVLADELGPIPVGGFFAAGEFGPVGGRNFLHGFTASIALLKDRGTAG